jgi:hypothetical protein
MRSAKQVYDIFMRRNAEPGAGHWLAQAVVLFTRKAQRSKSHHIKFPLSCAAAPLQDFPSPWLVSRVSNTPPVTWDTLRWVSSPSSPLPVLQDPSPPFTFPYSYIGPSLFIPTSHGTVPCSPHNLGSNICSPALFSSPVPVIRLFWCTFVTHFPRSSSQYCSWAASISH